MISRTNKGLVGARLLALALAALLCGAAWADDSGFDYGGGFGGRTAGFSEGAGFSHGRDFAGDHGQFGGFDSSALVRVRRFHGRSRFGGSFVFIAPGPFYDPFFYPVAPPYYGYYPPAVVAVPSAPPVYVERAPQAVPNAPGYWYWCSNPQGYYPTVEACPGGWQAVSPQPPSR